MCYLCSKNSKVVKDTLCFYSPNAVYSALIRNSEVKTWLKFISNHYNPPIAKVYLIYPCSAKKPYHKSRSYKILYKTLEMLGDKRYSVFVMTVSEPFGLVPEEFYGKKIKWHDWKDRWYDCPGLFEWWCKRYGQPYDKAVADKCIEILASYVAKFFKKLKAHNSSSRIVAFVRTYSSKLEEKSSHTHKRIIKLAAEKAKVNVDIIPPKEVVAEIVKNRGRLAWDLYGVAHPDAQKYLLKYLLGVLDDEA
ncbi:MAG: DUF5591 domain-containing protein [Candidatus Aenigmatarchaeota archaeon]